MEHMSSINTVNISSGGSPESETYLMSLHKQDLNNKVKAQSLAMLVFSNYNINRTGSGYNLVCFLNYQYQTNFLSACQSCCLSSCQNETTD